MIASFSFPFPYSCSATRPSHPCLSLHILEFHQTQDGKWSCYFEPPAIQDCKRTHCSKSRHPFPWNTRAMREVQGLQSLQVIIETVFNGNGSGKACHLIFWQSSSTTSWKPRAAYPTPFLPHRHLLASSREQSARCLLEKVAFDATREPILTRRQGCAIGALREALHWTPLPLYL